MKKHFPFFILFVVFSVILAGPLSHALGAAAPEPLAKTLDTAIDRALEEKRIAGAVVMIARRGTVIYQRAAGLADREALQPMRIDSIFRLSSVTKAFTAMAAAAQVRAGVIGLDDPVSKWLPEFTPALPNGKKPTVTVRHLLTHTAGLDYGFNETADGPYLRAGISDGLESSGLSLEENVKRIASVPLLFEPGTQWRYSLSMDVLGAVIAKAHGTSLQKAMLDLVTGPLEMQDAGFLVSDTSRLTAVYYFDGEDLQRMRTNEFLSIGQGTIHFSPNRARDHAAYPSGGAGMLATAPEVLTLLEAIRAGNTPVADKVCMREFSANQIGSQRISPGTGFALGWAVLLDPAAAKSPQSPGTLSWGGVYGHAWFIDPIQELSVVVMTTTALEGLGSTSLMNEIREALYRHLRADRTGPH